MEFAQINPSRNAGIGQVHFASGEDLRKYRDRALVALAQQGSQAAIKELIRRHYKEWVKFATYLLRDSAEAQDQVQNVCISVLKRLDQYRGEAEFSTWMRRIVANQCLMVIRASRPGRFRYIDADPSHEGTRPMEIRSAAANPEERVIDEELRSMLRSEMRCIPFALRTILAMHVDETPITDIAARLNITVPAAKSRLHRARTVLRERVINRYRGRRGHSTPPVVQMLPENRLSRNRKAA